MRRTRIALLAVSVACAPGDEAASPRAASDTLLAINGTELFVHREGQGEPVLVIHGGPLLDHGYMAGPLRPLSDAFELVFHDQRLSGRSAGTVDSASVRLATFVADVEALREMLGPEPVHVLGHSWGGLIAMKYAIAHPDAVRSLVLVSPMPPTAKLWQEAERALSASLQPHDTAGMGELRASPGIAAGEPGAIEELLRLSFRSQMHDPADAESLEFEIANDYGSRSRQFGLVLGDLAGYDLLADLRSLDVPVLLVYGASERGVEPGIRALRDALADATIVRLSAAGHFAFIERPDEFNRIVRSFLRSH